MELGFFGSCRGWVGQFHSCRSFCAWPSVDATKHDRVWILEGPPERRRDFPSPQLPVIQDGLIDLIGKRIQQHGQDEEESPRGAVEVRGHTQARDVRG